ncbi:hypothetical protein G6F23_015577 [Rhizopus arrhizus]|nr:hypothetical protein G6F23_015577 [Rhizopus arrhizus]
MNRATAATEAASAAPPPQARQPLRRAWRRGSACGAGSAAMAAATAALKPAGASAGACPRITSPSSCQRSALHRRPARRRPGPTAVRGGAGPGAARQGIDGSAIR